MKLANDAPIGSVLYDEYIDARTAFRIFEIVSIPHNGTFESNPRKRQVITRGLVAIVKPILVPVFLHKDPRETAVALASHVDVDVIVPRYEPFVANSAETRSPAEHIGDAVLQTHLVHIAKDPRKNALQSFQLLGIKLDGTPTIEACFRMSNVERPMLCT